MSKTAQPQGAFSFLDEVEKVEPLPKPKKNTLKPPAQIEISEEVTGMAEEIAEKAATAIAENTEPDIVEQETVAPGTDNRAVAETFERRPAGTRGRRSVKENAIAADAVEMPDEEELFKKHYYSMGEVTSMFKESHSLIRYWESEFDILKPKKNGKGDRFFRPQDVKNLFLIYDLLRRRKFTIEGAKEYLKNNKKADEKFAAVQSLQRIKGFLLELKAGI
ncbi:MerR family transcriptional regulator [Niabella ginsenosidivorans]|nr:MerR family transcriptional regulator [Niabella ginsenosidivorans]